MFVKLKPIPVTKYDQHHIQAVFSIRNLMIVRLLPTTALLISWSSANDLTFTIFVMVQLAPRGAL
jgi:hypothetical protein